MTKEAVCWIREGCVEIRGGGAACDATPEDTGCCVISEGNCIDGQELRPCIMGEGGVVWSEGNSCSNVPQCAIATPTFNQWGLISLMVILGIVGFMVIRRRKVSA